MPILYVQVGRKDGRARRHIATLELPTFKLPTLCEMVSRFFFFTIYCKTALENLDNSRSLFVISISLRKIIYENIWKYLSVSWIFKEGKSIGNWNTFDPPWSGIPRIFLHTQFPEFWRDIY